MLCNGMEYVMDKTTKNQTAAELRQARLAAKFGAGGGSVRGVQLMSKNPATVLKSGGQNPRSRGREKLNHTLLWLATFVRSNESIILQRLGVKGRGYMKRLEEMELVQAVACGTRGGQLWVLTRSGLTMAQGIWQKEFEHYPDRPERLSQATLRHDLAVQHIVAELMATGEAVAFQSASMLGKRSPEIWVPDALIRTSAGQWIGLEYERTPKYGEELLVKLNRIVRHINQKQHAGINITVRWYSHHHGPLGDYLKLMQGGMPSRRYYENLREWREDPEESEVTSLRNQSWVEFVPMERDLAKYM